MYFLCSLLNAFRDIVLVLIFPNSFIIFLVEIIAFSIRVFSIFWIFLNFRSRLYFLVVAFFFFLNIRGARWCVEAEEIMEKSAKALYSDLQGSTKVCTFDLWLSSS